MKDGPIGVFDSGVGGLTVVRELLSLLPEERFVYFADNAYLPYGSRPLDQVARFACDIVRFLEGQGVKLVVAGCNMSSGALLDGLFSPGKIPLLGLVEPAAHAAANNSSGRIGVLATTGSVRSRIYSRAIARVDPTCQVLEEACPEFVPLVEAGEFDSNQARLVVRAHLAPLLNWGMDTLLLGCTHYPFLLPLIEARIGEDIAVVDPALEAALAARQLLAKADALSLSLDGRAHDFFASGDPLELCSFAKKFLGLEVARLQRRDVHPVGA